MSCPRHLRRQPSFTANPPWWCVLAAVCLLGSASVPATCLNSSDPAIRRLQALISKDASAALKEAQASLDSVARTPHPDPLQVASLYGVLAQSYSALELDGEARNAALKGLEFVPDRKDPAHLQLLSAYAENVYDQEGIRNALASIEAAGATQTPGSIAATCLLITRGRLQFRQDRADLAIVSLTQAYQATMAPERAEQRVVAAGALASVAREMGDYPQALALNQEVIDWDSAHDSWLDLSVAKFLRGSIFLKMHELPGAIDAYTQARKLSERLGDQQGIAFADLNICRAEIELGQLTHARELCDNALRLFTAAQSTDVMKETRALLARIDVQEGHAGRARATLDEVLDKAGADLPARQVASFYEQRARVNATLHRYREAYADLDEYVRRYVVANDAERSRQTAALRARFETDRQIERNVSLQRELRATQEHSQRQKELLRWTALAVAAGLLVITLLTYILIASLRYRRQLVRLASQDSLTGLPNRRRMVELASVMLESAAAGRQPLTFAVIDFDYFKIINDRCGHAAGDHVLKEFARLSRDSLRGPDILGRWGGEEFLLVMPKTTPEAAVIILERLRKLALRIDLPATSAGMRVSVSAGLAANGPDATSLDEIVARADAALYKAKNQGRDRVLIADDNARTVLTVVQGGLVT